MPDTDGAVRAAVDLLGSAYAHPWIAFLVVCAGAAALFGAVRRGTPAVAMRPFMSGNELEFLGRIERALPEMRVHCQVAMGALLRPRVSEGGGRRRRFLYASIRARFDRKVVDYVLQDRATGRVVAVIELDDRTHVAARDRKRDAMMRRAGYVTIRWDSRRKPKPPEIRKRVLGVP